ncbi:MAG: acyloxyacyl hydrolase [Thermodesulfobacteriota bacterium]
MRKFLLLVLSLVLLSNIAMAESSGYGISFGYGAADSNIDIYRLGIKKDFTSKWFESNLGYFSGYFELSYNHLEHNNGDINAVVLSPVFVYYFGSESNTIRPYIKGGIGVAYLDEYHIADRNLSTNLQFENKIGVGTKIGLFGLNFLYIHYSNASIKEPNDGIDIWMFTTSIDF